MRDARNWILSLAAALGALSTTAPAQAAYTPETGETSQPGQVPAAAPNTFVSVGYDLLGFTVTQQADGTIVAAHSSHSSHSSHASHHSHYSSR
jgi:hypothetical protein